jgi:hypothetical protein
VAKSPKQVTIRTYQVGFGDCFLLSFQYAGSSTEKHVLIDFGTTKLPPGVPKTRMLAIANDIAKRTGGALHAVVATHRHADHISGFATAKSGKGSGDIIAGLKPAFVVQPWTEDPKLAPNAKGPSGRASDKKHIAALSAMHDVARQSLRIGNTARYLDKAVRGQLSFLGEDNIANPSAVRNLMTMSKKPVYLKAGDKAQFDTALGIKVHVLGPPTLKQTDTIAKQRSHDPTEFWQFRAAAARTTVPVADGKPAPLFPRFVASRGPHYPIETRWLIFHARTMQGNQMLEIVRSLDKAMNNTSVILVFEIGSKLLLFPGDAQIENWQYALSRKANQILLAGVNLYKVGHHGSLNATPKSLWNRFKNKSTNKGNKKRLGALMSTLEGKHGHKDSNTEVPRRTLVAALEASTNLFTTESLEKGKFFHDTVV